MVAPGGQAGTSSRIENYLGFPTGISGSELTQRALVQAEKFGAHLTAPRGATSLREQAGHLVVGLSDGTEIAGRAVIVATGARYRRLDVDRLVDFEGKGVYYAATTIEAWECDESPVVAVIIRGPDLNASMSRYLVDRLDAHERIDLRANTKIVGLDGDETLTSVRVAGENGDATLARAGLFSFIGAEPASERLSGCAALDERTSCSLTCR